MDSTSIVKYLMDTIPQGDHPNPCGEWVQVRLDVVTAAIEYIHCGTKASPVAENATHAEAARATARIAIDHLDSVLNKARTAHEQQAADTSARTWMASIGYEGK